MNILDNVKVLDLTRVISGPWATQLFADMGATVYKIEEPTGGDTTRKLSSALEVDGEEVDGYSAFYLGANRGKQSIQVDLANPQGAELVRRLAAQCDIVIENYKAGGLHKYGLDYASVRALNPAVVYCSISGFGVDGPYAKRPAYDFVLQGMAGLMSTCGHADGEPGAMPMRTAVPITDVASGMYAAVGILAALFHKQRTGEGQFIDIGMIDVSVAMNGHLALEYLITGKPPGRQGNANPVGSPSDVFECQDGHVIMMAGTNAQFLTLATAIGHPEWTQDPRYASPSLRLQNRAALTAQMNEATRRKTRAQWLQAMEAAGVPCGPINDLAEVFADAQVRHRDLALSIPHASGMQVPSLRNPLRFSQTPVAHRAPPLLGEHTDSALSQALGLSGSDIARLRSSGAIGAG